MLSVISVASDVVLSVLRRRTLYNLAGLSCSLLSLGRPSDVMLSRILLSLLRHVSSVSPFLRLPGVLSPPFHTTFHPYLLLPTLVLLQNSTYRIPRD